MSVLPLVIVSGDLSPDVMPIFLNTGGGRKVVQRVSAVSGDMERLLGHGTLEGYVSVFVWETPDGGRAHLLRAAGVPYTSYWPPEAPPVVNSELLPTGFQGESHV